MEITVGERNQPVKIVLSYPEKGFSFVTCSPLDYAIKLFDVDIPIDISSVKAKHKEEAEELIEWVEKRKKESKLLKRRDSFVKWVYQTYPKFSPPYHGSFSKESFLENFFDEHLSEFDYESSTPDEIFAHWKKKVKLTKKVNKVSTTYYELEIKE